MDKFDNIWLLLCTFLVFFMQAGFCGLEIGLVRTKNSINVALKNLVDFCLASFVFWVVGFGLMFGFSLNGFLGTTGFFFGSDNSDGGIAIFLYQMAFCGTAATIISGAVSERTTFKAYLLLTLVVSAIIYPTFGHWAWAGNIFSSQSGWLQNLGFIDFAGATVVHSIGGWTALAAIVIIGPRIGRFDRNINIQKSNPAITTVGILIMFIAWLGFNGGGFLKYTDEVPLIIMNTVLAGISGGLFPVILSIFIPRLDVIHYFSGVLAGLVSSTASAPFINSGESVLIGFIGAGVAIFRGLVLEKMKVDDVVQAVPVHGFAGVWGTLAVGLFGDYGILGNGPNDFNQLGVQIVGVLIGFWWAFGLGFILFWAINKLYPMRVSSQSEMAGLNISEHGASSDLQDFLHAMERQEITGNFSEPIPYEEGTEVSPIAEEYNRVLERVKANKKELRSVNHSKEAILNSAGKGIIGLDEFGKINFCNSEGLQLTGYQFSEIQNQPFHHLFQHTRVDGEPWLEKDSSITSTLTNREAYQIWEEVFWKSDGSSFPVDYVTAPIIEENTLKGAVIIFQDVSQRKEADEKKNKSTLEKEIDKETLRAKSIFLSRITHELRTPLNAILGFGGLLKKGLSNQFEDKNKDSVQIILESGDRLQRVINNILDLSHIEAGTVKLKPRSVPVQVMVSDVLARNASYAEQVGIRIVHEKMSEPYFEAWTDPEWFSVALNHVFVNAVQYNCDRGVVTVDYIFLKDQIGVRIADTGHGIPENRLVEILEPFNRLDADRVEVKGTGIGLTISQKILQLMGGSIQIESIVEEGSCFTILLPKKKDDSNIIDE